MYLIFKISTSNRNQRYFDDKNVFTFIPQDFRTAIIVLSAAMLKRRSRSIRNEFEYFKRFYEKQFREHLNIATINLLRSAFNSQLHISRICYQLSFKLSYEERLHIMHFLYGFAFSDHFVSDGELVMIRLIGRYLMLSEHDLDSVYAFYFSRNQHKSEEYYNDNMMSYYKILGVSQTASHEEIRKAYRALAMKHHPDKVAHLGEDIQASAKTKFQIIVDAYKKIRKTRGF